MEGEARAELSKDLGEEVQLGGSSIGAAVLIDGDVEPRGAERGEECDEGADEGGKDGGGREEIERHEVGEVVPAGCVDSFLTAGRAVRREERGVTCLVKRGESAGRSGMGEERVGE